MRLASSPLVASRSRAESLGLVGDESTDSIVRAYMEEYVLPGGSGMRTRPVLLDVESDQPMQTDQRWPTD